MTNDPLVYVSLLFFFLFGMFLFKKKFNNTLYVLIPAEDREFPLRLRDILKKHDVAATVGIRQAGHGYALLTSFSKYSFLGQPMVFGNMGKLKEGKRIVYVIDIREKITDKQALKELHMFLVNQLPDEDKKIVLEGYGTPTKKNLKNLSTN